jgi:predicted amidohydrolase
VIFTMYERDVESIYNTAVLIGRDGQIIGKYRKLHLPLSEVEMGLLPGNEYGVFDVDFGKIGIMTCYDQVFPETARTLSLQGAEIIFVPTMGDEPLITRARARDNGVYVVVSGYNGPESSRIINPMGDEICHVNSETEGMCACELDLNKRFFTYWLSVGACNGESKSLFNKERRIDIYKASIQP